MFSDHRQARQQVLACFAYFELIRGFSMTDQSQVVETPSTDTRRRSRWAAFFCLAVLRVRSCLEIAGRDVTLSSRSVTIDGSECCRAGGTLECARCQNRRRGALEDDPLVLERVSQLSRFRQVGGGHIEFQQFDA